MVGSFGDYSLTRGYFKCFDPTSLNRDQFKGEMDRLFMRDEDDPNPPYLSWATKSVALVFTSYNMPTRVYTSFSLLVEGLPTTGFITPSKIDIVPFKLPLNELNNQSMIAIMFFRVLSIVFLIVLTIITCVKKGSFEKVTSSTTFFEISFSLIIIAI